MTKKFFTLTIMMVSSLVLGGAAHFPQQSNPMAHSNFGPVMMRRLEEHHVRPMVALTFDDGPARPTERILDVLEKHDVPAGFFVLGSRVSAQPETLVRAANLGSELLNHGWSHTDLTTLSREAIRAEISDTSRAIEGATGIAPLRVLRPPYGRLSNRLRETAGEMGYAIVNWTVDTQDWRSRNAESVFEVVKREVKHGSIILMHDLHESTAEATELIVPWLIEEGYRIVTVTELLRHFYGELEPGRVYGTPNTNVR